ncbi:hypothetical protein F7725_005999 [Dissostichus mawsoni]|uniref:Nidogen 1b n=1 Tax=Dissostichus mawsoni TaxID=36200 RepID=A0A7J5YSU0_DISMA|nr:hypothetical protein F7725_005999 [Dissostichus mawsoni]
MIAPLLGDLEDSDGQGRVLFRWDSSPEVLNKSAEHIRRAFPRDEGVDPITVFIVTWENMAARGTNTFQLVVATMELSSCAILLYPRDGLQFLSTPVGGESKILEAGFNEGMVDGWFWKASLGTKTNSGQKGVWVYEIGSSPFFVAITPGVTPEDEEATELQSTVFPRQTEESQVEEIPTANEYQPIYPEIFTYNSETCAHNQQKCSAFADCRDYSQGKTTENEWKGERSSVHWELGYTHELSNNDLHSYVVTNDGRAYVAISNIPAGIGPSLQRAVLSRRSHRLGLRFGAARRLNIRQQFKGIDEHDHLVVSTELEGRLPDIPLGSSVQISPDHFLSNRDYTITSSEGNTQTRSYQWRQTITFQSCAHDEASRAAMSTQQLSVDQIFVMFDPENNLIRYAMSNKIGSVHSTLPEQNPCFTGRHGCDINAMCRPGEGLQFTCECSSGFTGEGRYCQDTDECRENPQICGANSVCNNQPGTFRCECFTGFVFASDGRTCIEENRPVDHCQRGTHDCDAPDRASCSYTGGSAFLCSCLPGFVGDGRVCRDVDECEQDVCHRGAFCSNSQGSFACQCHPGFHGDGFQCSPTSTEREQTVCERHRESAQSSSSSGSGIFSFFRPRPAVGQFVPQCDLHGAYEPTQCHGSIGQCWCIDQGVNPPPVGPTPRPDVHPVAPGTHLLFAQSGKIERVPLDGNSIKMDEAKPLLHIPDRVVIALSYDCVEKMVYWTDITGPSISRARLSGGGIIPVVTTDLQSPEGIAVDHVSRLLFWTDSMRDTVEVSKLDGSQRRVLFDTDLINPRPIVVNPAYG